MNHFLDEELTFIHPDDAALYNAWDSRAFEVQVANHELLGHGSGKLFQEGPDGKKNFDPEKVCDDCMNGSRHLQSESDTPLGPFAGNQPSYGKACVCCLFHRIEAVNYGGSVS